MILRGQPIGHFAVYVSNLSTDFDEILRTDRPRTRHVDSGGDPVQDMEPAFLDPDPDSGIFA